ncbi:relaxase [Actinomadura sp. 7K507]|uniref:relaxase/mobilization nuclease domain-containing protein n=1 Tax=Actinomadura sp. 7K507 TaxID=2530365 RepID=UPI0010524599|nr:relaxase [Actinomadura sp. 7K507]TDC86292.1 relaxase [Actinomadura sp. 7K507]
MTDEEWADVAEELMHQTGIALRGDAEACRWIAVRHADDHIHVVATLAREDGRRPNVTRDYLKARTACQIVERRYGLFRTAPADRTAAPRPSRAELERAERAGLEEPPRVSLRRQVATVAAVAESEDAFFVGLRERGLLVRLRFSVQTPGQITGYAVAVPGYRNSAKAPIYFSGGKLAADLTLPKLRHRWGAGAAVPTARRATRTQQPVLDHEARTAAYREAAHAAATAAWHMRHTSDPGVRADVASAASDVLHVTADITGNRELAKAADVYGRAAQEPFGRPSPTSSSGNGLRVAARIMAVTNIGRGDQRDRSRDFTVDLLFLIANLVEIMDAVAAHRESQQRAAQAGAARQAAGRLRTVRRQAALPVRPTPPRVAEVQDAERLAAESFPIPLSDGLRREPAGLWRPDRDHEPRRRGPKR